MPSDISLVTALCCWTAAAVQQQSAVTSEMSEGMQRAAAEAAGIGQAA